MAGVMTVPTAYILTVMNLTVITVTVMMVAVVVSLDHLAVIMPVVLILQMMNVVYVMVTAHPVRIVLAYQMAVHQKIIVALVMMMPQMIAQWIVLVTMAALPKKISAVFAMVIIFVKYLLVMKAM
jgi:hypothetical protein